MTMTRVSASAAARSFSDLLNRVRYRGEAFEIVRNGEAVAVIGQAPAPKPTTVRELLEALRSTSADPGFAEDLEHAQRDQPALPDDPWDT